MENDKSPSRKVGELDNRGSHFYLALYWAQGIANQDKNAELKAEFTPIAKALSNNEERIISELNEIQGQAVNIGAYYQPNDAIASEAMRPSTTLNTILQSV